MRSGVAGAEVAWGPSFALGALSVTLITFIPGIASDDAVVSAIRMPVLLATVFSLVGAVAVALLMKERAPASRNIRGAVADVPVVVGRAFVVARRPGTIRLLLAAGVVLGLAFSAVELFYEPLFRDMVDGTASATRLFGMLTLGLALASAAGSAVGSGDHGADGGVQLDDLISARCRVGSVDTLAFDIYPPQGVARPDRTFAENRPCLDYNVDLRRRH